MKGRRTASSDIELAVDATMAMLDRHGGGLRSWSREAIHRWSSDRDHVQRHLVTIMECLSELADDYPSGDDWARQILTEIVDHDLAP